MQLRRLVILVSAIVLVDTAFYAVVAPLLPRYTDDLSLSKLSAGILTAAYPAGTLSGAIPGGLLAARFGPKATVIVGLALLGASSFVFGLAHDVVLLDASRFVQGAGGACSWAGGLAWLTAEAPPERRGAVIGTALGAAIAGALFGPVLGTLADQTSPTIVFSTVLVFSAVLIAWASLAPASHVAEAQTLSDVRRALRLGDVRVAMWLVALPALGFGAMTVLGPLRLDGLGFSSAAIGAVFLVAAAVEAVESPLVGRVSDRRGRLVPIHTGLAGAMVLLCLFTVPQTGLVLGVLMVATTAALGAFWAPAMALLSDAADAAGVAQGIAFALVNLAWGVGEVGGSALGGALAKATSDIVPFGLCAAGCGVTLLALTRRRGMALPAPSGTHGHV